jgi:hypothetical protein
MGSTKTMDNTYSVLFLWEYETTVMATRLVSVKTRTFECKIS